MSREDVQAFQKLQWNWTKYSWTKLSTLYHVTQHTEAYSSTGSPGFSSLSEITSGLYLPKFSNSDASSSWSYFNIKRFNFIFLNFHNVHQVQRKDLLKHTKSIKSCLEIQRHPAFLKNGIVKPGEINRMTSSLKRPYNMYFISLFFAHW